MFSGDGEDIYIGLRQARLKWGLPLRQNGDCPEPGRQNTSLWRFSGDFSAWQ